MIDCRKAFLDTAPFIYYIEKNQNNPQNFEKIKAFLMKGYRDNVSFISSVITVEEYCVFPYREGELGYISLFEQLIAALSIEIINIDSRIAKKASQIRAEYRHFKSMDALQLATACLIGCDLFVTNDKQLRQFKEIKCVTVEEL